MGGWKAATQQKAGCCSTTTREPASLFLPFFFLFLTYTHFTYRQDSHISSVFDNKAQAAASSATARSFVRSTPPKLSSFPSILLSFFLSSPTSANPAVAVKPDPHTVGNDDIDGYHPITWQGVTVLCTHRVASHSIRVESVERESSSLSRQIL